MRVLVLTTSYPRHAGDAAGGFVADAVERVRAAGVEVEVVAPTAFRHFGLAYGDGMLANVRARPWRALALPLFVASFWRAARAPAKRADVVHAHWLLAGLVAVLLRKPAVIQVWGTDVALARRLPWLARPVLRRAHAVVAASEELAAQARALGARDVCVVPGGIDLPPEPAAPADPPRLLYVGRLAPEKGVRELAEAARGLPLDVAGDGPLRALLPQTPGFVPRDALAPLYTAAAVVVVPSLREGFGMACLEAMAYGRPVVASAVGGLRDLVVDGETGVLVPPGDVASLRAALERLLGDAQLRARLGAAARERARNYSWPALTERLVALYAEVSSPRVTT
jgi:2-deoxystreptamine N-acetyl-D-glucosaminyltransferase/2-deoxystreptamine glucosyltransferase